MVKDYGCYGCIHYHCERVFEPIGNEGYCDLDTAIHKKRFDCFHHEKCDKFIDCNIADIYKLISSCYNGVTLREIEDNFSFCNLNKLLGLLEKEGYITKVIQDNKIYYIS